MSSLYNRQVYASTVRSWLLLLLLMPAVFTQATVAMSQALSTIPTTSTPHLPPPTTPDSTAALLGVGVSSTTPLEDMVDSTTLLGVSSHVSSLDVTSTAPSESTSSPSLDNTVDSILSSSDVMPTSTMPSATQLMFSPTAALDVMDSSVPPSFDITVGPAASSSSTEGVAMSTSRLITTEPEDNPIIVQPTATLGDTIVSSASLITSALKFDGPVTTSTAAATLSDDSSLITSKPMVSTSVPIFSSASAPGATDPASSGSDSESGLDVAVIAGIAAGGAALVIIGFVIALVLLVFVLRKGSRKDSQAKPKKARRPVDRRSESFVLHKMNRQVFTDR